MSDIYGQYGVFIDDHTWEYDGAWNHYKFDMKNMKCEKIARDGLIESLTIKIYNGRLEAVGTAHVFGAPIQSEFRRYQHWIFEKAVLLEE